MNRILGIALCSFGVSVLASQNPSSSNISGSIAASTPLPTDPLEVPQIRSWLKKAEEEAKEPAVVTLIKNYVGQEPFHENPAHQRMLSAHLEQLMRNLNDSTVTHAAAFLNLCQQKGIQIDIMASDDLFRLAYHKRTALESKYKNTAEASLRVHETWRMQNIEELKKQIEAHKKTTETQITQLGTICTAMKQAHAPVANAYTTIMQLTQTLNPHYAPAYATDTKKYYADIEQEFVFVTKMQQQTALANHLQELTQLLTTISVMGKKPAPAPLSVARNADDSDANDSDDDSSDDDDDTVQPNSASSASKLTADEVVKLLQIVSPNLLVVTKTTPSEASKRAREKSLNLDEDYSRNVKVTINTKNDGTKPRKVFAAPASQVQPSPASSSATTAINANVALAKQ